MEEIIINEILIRGTKYPIVDEDNKKYIKIKESLFKIGRMIPYEKEKINTRCWRIEIYQGNSITNNIITPHTSIIIKLNENDVYECYAENLDMAFHKAKDRIYKLNKLMDKLDLTAPLNFKLLTHRNIYFKELLAKVAYINQNGFIHIVPDCKEKDLDDWWKNVKFPYLKNEIVYAGNTPFNKQLKIDILDERIIWDRHDRRDKIIKIMNNG